MLHFLSKLLAICISRLNTNTTYRSCTNDRNVQPICLTREYQDGVKRDEDWGYCSSECNGQRTDSNSSFNLANMDFKEVWEENFFDLRVFGAGYCYTYNPPEETGTKFENRLFMLLGSNKFGKKLDYYLLGFVVYLHEKGQFWPRLDLNIIGQSKPVHVKTFKEVIGQFSVSKIENINKADSPCTKTPDYSFTA